MSNASDDIATHLGRFAATPPSLPSPLTTRLLALAPTAPQHRPPPGSMPWHQARPVTRRSPTARPPPTPLRPSPPETNA
jgi:hypothetical protein